MMSIIGKQMPDSLRNDQIEQQKSSADNKELVEYESKDDNDDDDDNNYNIDDVNTEAITKEEEWIKKRKTELTTTRQIETHVKRQVVFEDGKVVEDSGPIVSTNTTEDTDKQETETTEKKDLGLPVLLDNKDVLLLNTDKEKNELIKVDDKDGGGLMVKSMVTRPDNGLVRESNEKRVVTHEETKNYVETADVRHKGDFTDEAYVNAVTSGVENIEEVLLSPESQRQLVPTGPRQVADKTKSFKTIDTEDVHKRSLAQADGKIITEHKTTTEHEIIVDDELPANKSLGSQEQIKTIEASQRFFKQRDEQHVDLTKDGKVVDTEMKYAAETMQIENDDLLERPGDWDSLSDRIRKMRRPHNKTVVQHPKGGLLLDRKDALTKRPLDFDREEETRKGETMKWLESHFGSESTASNDSREEDADIIEPTKKTFFNVTIKSNQNQAMPSTNSSTNANYNTYEKKPIGKRESESNLVSNINNNTNGNNGAKYYHGISNWNNRIEIGTTAVNTTNANPANHFASKAFRDDLHASIARSKMRKVSAVYSSRDNINSDKSYTKPKSSDNYVSREDILQQKRQSISSQFLARSRHNSRDHLDSLEKMGSGTTGPCSFEETRGSRTDLHYGMNIRDKEKLSYTRAEIIDEPDSPMVPRKNSYIEDKAKIYERNFIENNRYNSLRHDSTQHKVGPPEREFSTLDRPTVPQRKRNGDKKIRQQNSIPSVLTEVPLHEQQALTEPPPDYSPPTRSRSSSPKPDYYVHSYLRGKPAEGTFSHHRYSESGHDQISVIPKLSHDTSTLNRKQKQKTRFARNTPSPTPTTMEQHHTTFRPIMSTQTTQTTPSTISASTAATHRSNKVGKAIGNSLRKLVGKLRSASLERKIRMKSKSKSREQSPTTAGSLQDQMHQRDKTTYQQYNLIDGHIGATNQQHPISNDESDLEFSTSTHRVQHNKIEPESEKRIAHSNQSQTGGNNNNRDGYQIMSPKQRYYLGEDPYSSNLYGKENIHDSLKQQTHREIRNGGASHYNNREATNLNHDDRNRNSHTLGRYQKGNQRISGSTPNLNHGYRSTQTLPRKLNGNNPTVHQHETQRNNNSKPSSNGSSSVTVKPRQQSEQRIAYQPITQKTGPLKPARTYAKSLNRSKSFSIHAINGSNDPSPIYIEKLTSNNYSHNLQSSQAYKSNPYLFSSTKENTLQQAALKSPSIVNLISRSQRDLSKIGTNEDESDQYAERGEIRNFNNSTRNNIPTYRSGSYIEDDYRVRSAKKQQLQSKYSLDSRSSVDINKDTASIIRHDEYLREKTPGSGSTIIKVRNLDYRK